MSSWIFTAIIIIACIVYLKVVFSENTRYRIKLITGWICLTIMGFCNIFTYIFCTPVLLNLIVGILVIIQVVAEACQMVYRMSPTEEVIEVKVE